MLMKVMHHLKAFVDSARARSAAVAPIERRSEVCQRLAHTSAVIAARVGEARDSKTPRALDVMY